MASIRIKDGDEGYDEIWEEWNRNGRSGEFDRLWSGGFALYRCHDLTSERPDFYKVSGTGPVEVNERGAIVDPGYLGLNDRGDFMRVTMRDNKPIKVDYIPPVNE